MVGWHHRFNGQEFEQTQGDGEGQGGLVCCHLWGHRVRHDWVTEQHLPNVINKIFLFPNTMKSEGLVFLWHPNECLTEWECFSVEADHHEWCSLPHKPLAVSLWISPSGDVNQETANNFCLLIKSFTHPSLFHLLNLSQSVCAMHFCAFFLSVCTNILHFPMSFRKLCITVFAWRLS